MSSHLLFPQPVARFVICSISIKAVSGNVHVLIFLLSESFRIISSLIYENGCRLEVRIKAVRGMYAEFESPGMGSRRALI